MKKGQFWGQPPRVITFLGHNKIKNEFSTIKSLRV